MRDFSTEVRALLLLIVRSLVDAPDAATVQLNRAASPMTFEVRVAPNDIGKIIGKQGRTARSIRIIIAGCAHTFKHPPVAIDIAPNG